MIVTIDGPAGTGKSTVSKLLAERLGFEFLNTGAMYRAVAYASLQRGIDLNDAATVGGVASQIGIVFANNRLLLDGADVTEAIRNPEVTLGASVVAANPEVRRKLVDLQRAAARGTNLVTEGRDQGTVVFPNAECKFFLTASSQVRALRRQKELEEKGEFIPLEELLAQQDLRDNRDETRECSPLVPAIDAVVIDTTTMTREEVVRQMEETVQQRQRLGQLVSFSTLACPDWTWHDVLRHGGPFGYDGVEIRLLSRETNLLAVFDLHSSQRAARRRELHEAGFRVAGLASSVRFDHETQAERDEQYQTGLRYIDLCVELEAGFIRVFGDTLPSGDEAARQTRMQQIADGVRRLGEAASNANVQILLETHGDFSASPPCVEVMQAVDHPNVGLVWDTHHPWRFHGEAVADTWASLKKWVRHTHWKDSVTEATHVESVEATEAARTAHQLMSGHQRANYVLFREGEFPAVDCIRALIRGGYSGWHSLEWEKMWHPELAPPEIALPPFPARLKELIVRCC